jgi:NDP-sugar pyrophosphorylase family protein
VERAALTGPVRQAAFLVGGLGTRLGALTERLPKPLLPVAGRPFLDRLLEKAAGHGLTRILLLAGVKSEAVEAYLAADRPAERHGLQIALSIEQTPLGTGGALVQAAPLLDDAFLLANGDTWFDFDWSLLAAATGFPAVAALRTVPHPDRYETVSLDGGRITGVHGRGAPAATALINGGAYRLEKAILTGATAPMSLETTLLPALCRDGRLGGQVFEGAFIDIGVPESYAQAQSMFSA